MADINNILANLTRSSANDAQHARQSSSSSYPFGTATPSGNPSAHYQPPTVSSPILSPPPNSEKRGAEGMSGNPILGVASPAPEQADADRKANLLNLLKFNQSSTPADSTSQPLGLPRPSFTANDAPQIARNPSASSVRGISGFTSPPPNQPSPSIENPQDQLLKLLNQSHANKNASAGNVSVNPFLRGGDRRSSGEEDRPIKREDTPVRVFGMAESTTSPFRPAESTAKSSIFTYVNPFDQLSQPSAQSSSQPNILQPLTGGTVADSVNSNVDLTQPTPKQPQPDAQPDSVASMLTEVAEQADRQAEDALERVSTEKPRTTDVSKQQEEAEIMAKAMQEAAKDLKAEISTPEGKAALEETMPKEMAEGFKQAVKEIAQDGVADSWESAEAEDSPTKTDAEPVRVYGLPMRPYVSIDVNGEAFRSSNAREDIAVKVASFKKEFDQVDRTLASSTANFIVYAISKGGGFRVIRQHDGANKQVFKKGDNRIFNVCVSEPTKADWEDPKQTASVLATGVNGSVYWTSILMKGDRSWGRSDTFDEDLDQRGFIFPPLPSQDDNVTTHQLKTRAKLSSKHSEFFAISRGKSIYVVWPEVAGNARYTDPATRIVNSEKYVSEHTLKIATAKAGKDFAFSADDTMIVSLDKAGRLKFWDIHEHTLPGTAAKLTKQPPVEIKVPSLTLNVAPVTEKSWPTSVMFVDKERASQKNVALRYLLVGMRQNHTIQLWDLGLGRAVQELNFPQDEETDPICSLVYHAKSSIIVLGHPKRNSIFFIHLSAPRYNLPSMSQRDYIKRLAEKDSYLPRPDSTAIMSGIREVSLASLGGELRSLDAMSPANKDSQEEESVFEVYTMHSRGVTYLNMKKRDLGWTTDGKVLKPLDAEQTGVITIKTLQQAPLPSEEGSTSSVPQTVPDKVEKPVTKPAQQLAAANGEQTKGEKKKSSKKKENEETALPKSADKTASYANAASRVPEPSPSLPIRSPAAAESGPKQSVSRSVAEAPFHPVSIPQPAMIAPSTVTPNIEAGNTEAFSKTVSEQIESLYKKIDEGLRVQQAAANAHLDAVLRLVSSTLTDNVEKNLTRIIGSNIQEHVVPNLTKSVGTDMERQLSTAVNSQFSTSIPRELQRALPQAIGRAMQDPETLRIISELVSSKIATQVDKDFTAAMNNTITPAFRTLAINSAQSMTQEVERRVGEQLHHYEMQRNADNVKIDHLTNVTSELLNTIHNINGVQSEMKQQLADLQAVVGGTPSRRSTSQSHSSTAQAQAQAQSQSKDTELEAITELMSSGRVEEGTIRWLQSGRASELFEKLFVRCNPAYLRDVTQIVAVSVAATVTSSFDSHIAERLNWLEVIFESINVKDPEITGHAPRLLDILTQRLQDLYMQISEIEPRNNVLGKIHALVRQAKELKAATG